MNPLQKHFRQPKIYIQLPSNGQYYPEGVLTGDASNVPIYAMTGMDELIMKTPDALFNGEATVKVIESCCPYITDAKLVPNIDVDALLAAIRIATFGDSIPIIHKCSECSEENSYDVSAQQIVDHFISLEYNNVIQFDDLSVFLRPLTYEQMTLFNIENFALQQTLKQLSMVEDTIKRQEIFDELYSKLGFLQVGIFVASIDSIHTDNEIVSDRQYITEWLSNCDREYYSKIKSHLEEVKNIWVMPKSRVKCTSCGNEEDIDVALDQSHFFV